MGRINCPEHGKQPIVSVSPDVEAAVHDGRALVGLQEVEFLSREDYEDELEEAAFYGEEMSWDLAVPILVSPAYKALHGLEGDGVFIVDKAESPALAAELGKSYVCRACLQACLA